MRKTEKLPSDYIAQGWTKFAYARDTNRNRIENFSDVAIECYDPDRLEYGIKVNVGDPAANCWCYTGAILEYVHNSNPENLVATTNDFTQTTIEILEQEPDPRIEHTYDMPEISSKEHAIQYWNDHHSTTQFEVFCLAKDVEDQLKEIL